MGEYFDVLDENGKPTGIQKSREECHKEGLWHRAVLVFILDPDNKHVLLQCRSPKKRMWPNLWDVTAGGHVTAGDDATRAIIRETKEELGLDIDESELEFVEEKKSIHIQKDIINKHFNDMYVIHRDVNLDDIVMQESEVQDVRWFDIDEVICRVNNNYEGITDKANAWTGLINYVKREREKSNLDSSRNNSDDELLY